MERSTAINSIVVIFSPVDLSGLTRGTTYEAEATTANDFTSADRVVSTTFATVAGPVVLAYDDDLSHGGNDNFGYRVRTRQSGYGKRRGADAVPHVEPDDSEPDEWNVDRTENHHGRDDRVQS